MTRVARKGTWNENNEFVQKKYLKIEKYNNHVIQKNVFQNKGKKTMQNRQKHAKMY